MNLTYFVAPLRCPRCGAVTTDETTLMESSLRSRDEPALIGVGDRVEPARIPRRYAALRSPGPAHGAPMRLLELWTCPVCGYANWGEVTLDGDGVVTGIAAVTPDEAALAGVDYVTLSAVDELESLLGGRAMDEDGVTLRPELVPRLLDILPPLAPAEADQ